MRNVGGGKLKILTADVQSIHFLEIPWYVNCVDIVAWMSATAVRVGEYEADEPNRGGSNSRGAGGGSTLSDCKGMGYD